ncbi:S9 family peptidase [Nonomuraea sp. NPDC050547]|uniref:S9 family peptidase n=1 Tax=unclassified Nonomuraea TaxID=2593643 RepID=UPI0037A74DCF
MMVAQGGRTFSAVGVHAGEPMWLERRPDEDGRRVLCRLDDAGEVRDLTPTPFNVRSLVHEFGGGAFATRGENLYFVHFDDQRIYRMVSNGKPEPITPESTTESSVRHGDLHVAPGGRALVCVRERREAGCVHNEIVLLPTDGSAEPQVIASGRDLYAAPKISPDGRQIAWLEWDNPRMPWDGTELMVGRLSPDGTVGDVELVAGGEDESVFQPSWSPAGLLHFVSDRTNWWNLYRVSGGTQVPLASVEAEFGYPMWAMGLSTYTFLEDGRIMCLFGKGPFLSLGVIENDALRQIDLPHRAFRAYICAAGDRCVVIGGGPTMADEIVTVSDEKITSLRTSGSAAVPKSALSEPVAVSVRGRRGQECHGLYYPPKNDAHHGPADKAPPLLVNCHAGPTLHVNGMMQLELQFFTSRGFAVLDMDYSGSTGYGREYRQRLIGHYGIIDVEDCADLALELADRGLADRDRLAIRGWSAGGFLALSALVHHDVFGAAVSYYGQSDATRIGTLATKFERGYAIAMLGSRPEDVEERRKRSPVHLAQQIKKPVLFLQGLADKAVPPVLAERLSATLSANDVPHKLVTFENEGHGFRQPETIVRAFSEEFAFYGRVFDFLPGEAS